MMLVNRLRRAAELARLTAAAGIAVVVLPAVVIAVALVRQSRWP
jgi:hypothetical protein